MPEGARSGGHESTGTLDSFRSEFALYYLKLDWCMYHI